MESREDILWFIVFPWEFEVMNTYWSLSLRTLVESNGHRQWHLSPPAVPLQRPTDLYANIWAYSFCERMLVFFLGHSLYSAYAEGRMVCSYTSSIKLDYLCFPKRKLFIQKILGYMHYSFTTHLNSIRSIFQYSAWQST